MAAFQAATSCCRILRAGVVQARSKISHLLFSLYVNDIPTPSRHLELAQYDDDTTLVETSKHPALLVKYLEIHVYELEKWRRDWRIPINTGKSAALLFRNIYIQPPRPLRFLGEEIGWQEKVKYSGSHPG